MQVTAQVEPVGHVMVPHALLPLHAMLHDQPVGQATEPQCCDVQSILHVFAIVSHEVHPVGHVTVTHQLLSHARPLSQSAFVEHA